VNFRSLEAEGGPRISKWNEPSIPQMGVIIPCHPFDPLLTTSLLSTPIVSLSVDVFSLRFQCICLQSPEKFDTSVWETEIIRSFLGFWKLIIHKCCRIYIWQHLFDTEITKHWFLGRVCTWSTMLANAKAGSAPMDARVHRKRKGNCLISNRL